MTNLKSINIPTVIALLQPHTNIRNIIKFQEQLKRWKKKTNSKEIGTQTGETSQKKDLKEILNADAVGMRLLNRKVLYEQGRIILMDSIIRHFHLVRMPLTVEIRDDLAEQIVKMFPAEKAVNLHLILVCFKYRCDL